MSASPEAVKQAVQATLDRLNMHGEIADVHDAYDAVRRMQEKKILEAFNGIFSDYGLEDLQTARTALAAMVPKRESLSITASYVAPPPAPAPAPVLKSKPKKEKR